MLHPNLAAGAQITKQCTAIVGICSPMTQLSPGHGLWIDNFIKDGNVTGGRDITAPGHCFNHLIDLSAGLCGATLCWFVIGSICATQHFNPLPGQHSLS